MVGALVALRSRRHEHDPTARRRRGHLAAASTSARRLSATGRSSRLLLLLGLLSSLESSSPASSTSAGSRPRSRVRRPPRHPGRGPDADHAHRRHRPVGGHRGHDDGVRHGHPGPVQGPALAILLALVGGCVVGLANGIGVGIFRVHPLIMTLAMAWSCRACCWSTSASCSAAACSVPEVITWLGTGRSFGTSPTRCWCSSRWRPHLVGLLRRTGFGRLLYAVGDNEGAARLAGVRVWQVLIVLYILECPARGHRRPALHRAGEGQHALAGGPARAALGGGGGHRRDIDLRWARRLRRDASSGR